MEPITKHYEECWQLMPRLRPLVTPKELSIPFEKLMNRKWKKTLNEQGRVKPCNDYLEAFLNTDGRVALYYIADLLHKLNLSVSYEMFRLESGYDLFEESVRVQREEQADYMERENYDAAEPQIIYKLDDIFDLHSNLKENPEQLTECNADVIDEIWDELKLWPALEGHKRPVKRGEAEYDDFLLQVANPIGNSTPVKKRTKYQKMRDYSYEMTGPAPMMYRGENNYGP